MRFRSSRAIACREIEPPDLRKFVTHLQSTGLDVGSVRKYIAPLEAMFATAYDDGDLPANPTYRLRIAGRRDGEDAPEQRAKAMTRAELAAVLGAIDVRWRLPFELLAQTGLRISELLGLDWEDLELGDRSRLQIRRQCYPWHPQVTYEDRCRKASCAAVFWHGTCAVVSGRPPKGSGPMFSTRTGARMQDRYLRRVLDAASETAGVPWIGFHTFRDTCASMLLESGKNIRQIAAWLGHEDPAFTLRTYTHLMDDGLGDAAFFDDFIPNEQGDARVGNIWATGRPQTAANAGKAARA